ncbi:MAG: Coenzyme F420 hydrogenase/dehydrogenase, beta subunit C-terminal domain [Acutalibacteraceae bacterium]|jgi:coenzyme F420-reducing hydrogenase beta subunit
MINISEKSRCCGCTCCAGVCPEECIHMHFCDEGFQYPKTDTEKCINCGLCEKVCPIINPQLKIDRFEMPTAYAAIINDEPLRLESSSGGVFTLLAFHVINKDGVVFGAAFSDDFQTVSHIAVESVDKLERLRGSKYVQSSIDSAYGQAKEYLDAGRMVLFTGTPCQIAGLYAYLGQDYDNLITQDVVCHGVPSPHIWAEYVKLREKKAKSKTRNVSFRHKKHGWKYFDMRFEFTNGTEYIKTVSEDMYMRGFLDNIYLRPSCYDCSFKSIPKHSDITLADFWGIWDLIPEMFDDKGTSLVLLNSDKGKALFEQIQSKLVFRHVDCMQAVQFNSAATKSADLPKCRDDFFKVFKEQGLNKALNKYCRVKFIVKFKRKIRKLLSKTMKFIIGNKA